jgi:hypothetical protein
MDFVTIADLARRPIKAVLGFEQHADPADPSFSMPVLRVRCKPALDEPACLPPGTADPNRSAELTPKPGARAPAGRLADAQGAGRGGPHLPAPLWRMGTGARAGRGSDRALLGTQGGPAIRQLVAGLPSPGWRNSV